MSDHFKSTFTFNWPLNLILGFVFGLPVGIAIEGLTVAAVVGALVAGGVGAVGSYWFTRWLFRSLT